MASSSAAANESRLSNPDDHVDVEDFSRLVSEVTEAVEDYCKSRPGVVAGVLFGLGFFCGWKLRPW